MRELLRDEQGQGLVEYAMLIAVVSVALIAGMVLLQDQIGDLFSTVGNALP